MYNNDDPAVKSSPPADSQVSYDADIIALFAGPGTEQSLSDGDDPGSYSLPRSETYLLRAWSPHWHSSSAYSLSQEQPQPQAPPSQAVVAMTPPSRQPLANIRIPRSADNQVSFNSFYYQVHPAQNQIIAGPTWTIL